VCFRLTDNALHPDLDLGRNWPISQSGRSFLYCLSI